MKKIITILILTITVSNIYSQKIDYTKSYATVYEQLMKAKMYQRCVQYFDSSIIADKNDELAELFLSDYYNYRSNAKEKLGDFEGSIEDNLKSFPSKNDMFYSEGDDIERYVYIANLYLKSSTPEKAISMFDKKLVDTIDIDLEVAKIKFMDKRWNDYLSYKDNNKRIETLNTILKDSPKNFILLADRGLCYYLNGEYKKGLTDLNKSISINLENYVWSYIFRAAINKQLQENSYKDDYNKALQICNKVLQINKSPENYLTRAIVYAYLKQYDKAITDCDNEHNKYKTDYITYDIKKIIYSYLFTILR